MVDKKTGKGACVEFVNDLAGNLPVNYACFLFNKGYYVQSFEPGELALRLEEAIAQPGDASKQQIEEWTKLKDSINENDNAYLFVGKLK